jgi:hypothetical protein
MTTDNFCFNLQNRLIQTNKTGGQQYSDTPTPFSIPCVYQCVSLSLLYIICWQDWGISEWSPTQCSKVNVFAVIYRLPSLIFIYKVMASPSGA